jgi:glucose-1-phosphate cytidylyltransferase
VLPLLVRTVAVDSPPDRPEDAESRNEGRGVNPDALSGPAENGGAVRVVILAGGSGSRLSEETVDKPKPMVEIGTHPILWHIMKIYGHHDFRDFVIPLGYKGEVIKRYFAEYASLSGDLTVEMGRGTVELHRGASEDWTVRLVDTGLTTATGGRMRRVRAHLDSTFMMTFGDGVADIDIDELVRFHRAHGKLATLTAVRPPARFGHVELDGDRVDVFSEKPQAGEGWINGGFFVLEPEVLDYIEGDDVYFQKEPLERLANEGQLMAYRHGSFWQCMDTLRDKVYLQDLWESGSAPWKVWA